MSGYYEGVTSLPTIDKTPREELDYTFNWAKWLAAVNDAITSYTLTVPDGITLVSQVRDGAYITPTIAGGTVGASYAITCEIDTPTRKADRTIVIRIVPTK